MPERVRQTRIYEKVVEAIKGDIASGRLKPRDPLPPERALMDQMGVSRSSLREAFRVLELMGLIESIPGKGRFVRSPRKTAVDAKERGDRGLPLEDEAILELMEARRVLDPAIAREAASRAMPSDLTKMRRVLSSTAQSLDNLESRAKGDFEFHLAMAEATKNFVFVNIVRMNFNLIMATHDRIYALLEDKDAFLNEHQALYEAILDRDPQRAEQAAKEHIERIYKTLQEVLALGGHPKGGS